MTRIGLLSDTHGTIHPAVFDFFKDCHEIWHAGDLGSVEVLDNLMKFKPTRAVYGNIDGVDVRSAIPQEQIFSCEQVKVFMIHIGGYPGRYNPHARKVIETERPGLFISGHSHILKVMNDKRYNLLHINPGATGNSGLHQKITLVRFTVNGNRISDLEIFEAMRKNRFDIY